MEIQYILPLNFDKIYYSRTKTYSSRTNQHKCIFLLYNIFKDDSLQEHP